MTIKIKAMSEENKDIHELNLHETTTLNNSMVVMRVPSGWIYDCWDYEKQEYKQGVFVPFSSDFQKVYSTPEMEDNSILGAKEFLTETLNSVTPEKHSNGAYYKDSNMRTLFYQDNESKTFWVDYYRVWAYLKKGYSLNDQQLSDLISTAVEEVLKFKPHTPWSFLFSSV